jgi:ketohexokinase
MIIQSKRDDTRTIVSHGSDLPEMTAAEFVDRFRAVTAKEQERKVWVHFEGRVPDVTGECVGSLRGLDGKGELGISVECEKPDRRGMEGVAELADVVFYSKLWAEVCCSDVVRVGRTLLTMYRNYIETLTQRRFWRSRCIG